MISTVGYNFLLVKRAKINNAINEENNIEKKMIRMVKEYFLLELYLSAKPTKALER
ncbi:MAG: hypothetical protein ACI4U5_06725 [Bacilli bacterium]